MSVAHSLPLAPLLRSFRTLPTGSRPTSLFRARSEWLHRDFLDNASDHEFVSRLLAFYEELVEPPLFRAVVERRARLIRHGLQHLCHAHDSIDEKYARCTRVDGPYTVAGLGPSFWSAIVKAFAPERLPWYSPFIERGLQRLGLLPRGAGPWARCISAYDRLLRYDSTLDAWDWDQFLTRVAWLKGRELSQVELPPRPWSLATDLVRRERTRLPLRRRLRDQRPAHQFAAEQCRTGLLTGDIDQVWQAIQRIEPLGCARLAPDAQWLPLMLELWNDDEHFDALAAIAGWLPAALLHLREHGQAPLWNESTRAGLALLNDGLELSARPSERYQVFRAGCAAMLEHLRLHPLEIADLLSAFAALPIHRPEVMEPGRFAGFCADSVGFLNDLTGHNAREWMDQQRERYQFAVREPMRELCTELVNRYIDPVLRRTYGWDIETLPRTGRALSSICKNDYGRSAPYQPEMWIMFYRRNEHGKRNAVQLFVRLDGTGLSYGFHLGRTARESGRLLRRNVQEHAEVLYHALQRGGSAKLTFRSDGAVIDIQSAADLRAWAGGKTLAVEVHCDEQHLLLDVDERIGDIVLTFNRVLPLFICANEADPVPLLEPDPQAQTPRFDVNDFQKMTFLNRNFLDRATELLGMKRQLILQGVPGTGKTHVARSLARWLTNDRAGAVRMVQFHPAYSYEEFVEGIKARTVEVNGRQEVMYPVEDGLLLSFAAEAAAQPDAPFVLLIDEINRGNLARIFGELLYVLEYRDQAVSLPYSRRLFQLPANLYLLGTMNSADRSVAPIDQALRRRFSFLDMPPDPAILASWLIQHPPPAGDAFAMQLVQRFESLNARLLDELGAEAQVGHSYFMLHRLDEATLRTIWAHQIRPLLASYFTLQPQRLERYEFDEWWFGTRRPRSARPRSGESS